MDRAFGREEQPMAKKRHSSEQIVRMLRETEVELSRGATVKDVCKKLGMTEVTYTRWRKEYGGLQVDQTRRLKELDIAILKKVAEERY